jgi:hypothetical protein
VTVLAPQARPDPLLAVRTALLARAAADAQRLHAEADADADEIITRARAEADAIRTEARAQGEADAAAELVAERARARRQARGVVLRAQRECFDELRTRAVLAAASLRDDPSYSEWCDRMRSRLRSALGDEVIISEHPAGGLLGEVPGRRVELTLAGLAEQALNDLGPDVERLWSP